MKNSYLIILLVAMIGCVTEGYEGSPEDLKIVNQGEVILDLSDIDYYDFSILSPKIGLE